MNILILIAIGVVIFVAGFSVSRLFRNKMGGIGLPKWSNRDLDSTIVAIGMLIIFGRFVEEANVGDKDVFTRLVELFNGVWLLILGFLFGKMNNGNGHGGGEVDDNGTS